MTNLAFAILAHYRRGPMRSRANIDVLLLGLGV